MPRIASFTPLTRRSAFRSVAAVAALGLAVGGLSVMPVESASADSRGCSDGLYGVPAGVFEVDIVANGGQGKGGRDYTAGPSGGAGGYGSTISVTNVGVTPGETIYWGTIQGGSNSRYPPPTSSVGGDGVWVAPVACIADDPDSVIVVAAGGGGGGDADMYGRGGDGGNADAPGGAGGRGGPEGENGANAGAGGTGGTSAVPGIGGASGHAQTLIGDLQDEPGDDGTWMYGPFDTRHPRVGGDGTSLGSDATRGGGGGGGGYTGGGGGGDTGASLFSDNGGGGGGGGGGASYPLSFATINYSGAVGATFTPKYTPAVTLASSANPQPLGSPVTFTAIVSSQNPDVKLGGGSVEFADQTAGTASGDVPLGAVPLTLDSTGMIGTASITVPNLAGGRRDINAFYTGFGGYGPGDPGHMHYINNYSSFTNLTQTMVQPQTLTFTAPVSGGTANGATARPAATSTSGLPVSIRVDSESAGVCSLSDDGVLSYLIGGTCVLDANQAGDDLYAAAPQVQKDVTVAAAKTQAITFTSAPPAHAVYGDTYTPTATGGDSGNPVLFDAAHSNQQVCVVVNQKVVDIKQGGTCTVYAYQAGGNGYAPAPEITQSFTVDPTPGTLMFRGAPPTSPKVGDTYTADDYTVYPHIGSVPGLLTVDPASTACTLGPTHYGQDTSFETVGTVTYSGVGICIIDGDASNPASAALAAVARVQQISTVAGTAQRITFTSNDPADPTYGGSTTVSATSSSGLPVTFTSATPATCSVSGADIALVGAGECDIHADQGGDTTTWGAAPTVTKKLVIAPAPLTIAAPTDSAVYGAVPTAFAASYDGFVAGDDPTSLTVQPLCTRSSTEPGAGTYPVTCSGAVDSDYAFVYVAGAETIAPALLTVTASSGTTGYGLAVPTVTASYSGFVNGDTALAATPTCGTEATDQSAVGDYATSCSGGTDPNYAITSVDGRISITRATLIVTASSTNRSYGDAAPAITASYQGLQGGDTTPATPPTCTSPVNAHTHPGDYASTCSGTSDPNYTIAYSNGAVHVTPAALTVLSPHPTTPYGTPVAVDPQYEGLVGGDTAPATPATCLTTATSSSPVGTYPVDCSGAADQDYTISYRPGLLSVAPVTLTVTASSASIAWGVPVPAIVPSYSGLVLDQIAPARLPTCSAGAAWHSPVGTYATSCSGAADANYAITYVEGALTVVASTTTAAIPTTPAVVLGNAVPKPDPLPGATRRHVIHEDATRRHVIRSTLPGCRVLIRGRHIRGLGCGFVVDGCHAYRGRNARGAGVLAFAGARVVRRARCRDGADPTPACSPVAATGRKGAGGRPMGRR